MMEKDLEILRELTNKWDTAWKNYMAALDLPASGPLRVNAMLYHKNQAEHWFTQVQRQLTHMQHKHGRTPSTRLAVDA